MSTDKALRFYLLAVCFVAMVCAAITAGMALYKVVKIAAPELTLDAWTYSAHQSLENFRNSQYNPDNRPKMALSPPRPIGPQGLALGTAGNAESVAQPMSDEALEQLRQKSYQQVLTNHRRSALQELVRLSIVLLISGLLFFTHWRMARRTTPD